MIKMNKRNGYLISKALHTFMWASILSSVAQMLSTLVDAVVVSNLIGPDAISAVNVSVPVTTPFVARPLVLPDWSPNQRSGLI